MSSEYADQVDREVFALSSSFRGVIEDIAAGNAEPAVYTRTIKTVCRIVTDHYDEISDLLWADR